MIITLLDVQKLCIFISRIDVLLHYMKSGGPNKIRESIDKLGQRIKIFFNYQFINVSNMTNKLLQPIYDVYPLIKEKQIECKLLNSKEGKGWQDKSCRDIAWIYASDHQNLNASADQLPKSYICT